MAALGFQPGLASGGKLSAEEYEARKEQCTKEALERCGAALIVACARGLGAGYVCVGLRRPQSLCRRRPTFGGGATQCIPSTSISLRSAAACLSPRSLQASAEYKRWERERARRGAAPLAARPALAAVALALSVLLAATGATYGLWARSGAPAGPAPAGRAEPAPLQLERPPIPVTVADLDVVGILSQVAEKLQPASEAAAQQQQLEEPAADQTEAAAPEAAAPPAAAEEGELQQRLAAQAATAAALEQQLREAQAALDAERSERSAAEKRNTFLNHRLSAADKKAGALREDVAALQGTVAALEAQNAQLAAVAAQAAVASLDAPPDGGSCPAPEAASTVLGAWPALYLLYSAATLALLGVAGAWRLHVRRRSARAAAPAAELARLQHELEAAQRAAAELGRTKQALLKARAFCWPAGRRGSVLFAGQLRHTVLLQWQRGLTCCAAGIAALQENKALKGQLETARAEAAARIAGVEQAHQALLQVGGWRAGAAQAVLL